MGYTVVFSQAFERQLLRLVGKNPQLEGRVRKAVKQLQKDVRHPSLRLHELSGVSNWSASVTRDIRIILHIEGGTLFLTRSGSHNGVY